MDKQFFQHYSGLKVAEDGEFFVPKNHRQPEHFTYGSEDIDGYMRVQYKGKTYRTHIIIYEVFKNNNQPLNTNVYAVHHINENKKDNRKENLLLLLKTEHNRLHKLGNQYNIGRLHTKEAKEKMSNSKKGKYIGADNSMAKAIYGTSKTNGEIVYFQCVAEAERELGINHSDIIKCCRNKLKSAGGYVWRYA